MYLNKYISYKHSAEDILNFLYEIKYVILLYVIGDYFTTSHALGTGIGFEENGFLAGLMSEYGIWSLAAVKVGIIAIVYWNYRTIKSSNNPANDPLWSFSKTGLGLLGLVLVVNNLMVIGMRISLFEYIGFL